MLAIFAIISALLVLASMPPYLIDMFKGKTKPERASWLIWAVLGAIAFVSDYSLGVTWSLVFIGIDLLYCFVVLALSIGRGAWGWKTIDKVALAVAAIGIVFSLIFRQPILALLGVIVADIAGTILTFAKTFHHPESETTISWVLTGSAAVFSALAVGRLDFGLLIYPIYIALANYVILLAQIAGRSKLNRYAEISETS
jgi:hypothetical protein